MTFFYIEAQKKYNDIISPPNQYLSFSFSFLLPHHIV